MAIKIFSIKNKATGKVERLIKAETKGQVNKHLAASVEIEPIGAVEIVDLLGQGTLIVEDATAQAADDSAAPAAPEAPAAPTAPAAAPETPETLEGPGADGDSVPAAE